MFTGLVEEVGLIAAVTETENGRRMRIAAAHVTGGLRVGDSIAVDGVCLTVVAHDAAGFDVEVIGTTLSRTTLGDVVVHEPVNLERALAFGSRLGGHIVQGHVDATAEVTRVAREGEHVLLEVALPADVADVTTLHGSVTLSGVSLTVNALLSNDVVQVALIPHTWEHTNLRHLREGDRVNVEGDMIGRFVAHYLARRDSVSGRTQ